MAVSWALMALFIILSDEATGATAARLGRVHRNDQSGAELEVSLGSAAALGGVKEEHFLTKTP